MAPPVRRDVLPTRAPVLRLDLDAARDDRPPSAPAARSGTAATAAPPAPDTPGRLAHRGKVAAAALGVLALAAGGVSVARELDKDPVRAGTPTTVAAAPADCLRTWNGPGNEATGALAQLGAGAIVRVARVDALPGTLLRGRPCAVAVTVPATGARAVWVDGVRGRAGYLDVSGYPAARRYGAPKDAAAANATVRADGTLAAR